MSKVIDSNDVEDTGKKSRLRCRLLTFGCQMNEYDSQVASGLLAHDGFEIIGDEDKADVVLMNTCSVREHAEDRVYGRLGILGHAKKSNPDLIVGLMGCMVEEHKEKLFKRFPQLDLMVGTRNIKDLPALIEKVRQTRRQVSQIKQDGISIEYTDQIQRTSPHHAWLPIMTGCNKVCTFCIVPITRGSEVSMPAREVYREASRLAEDGVKWITLLGQNVNSYNGDGVDFPQLLENLCQIEGLGRISFTTSHPHDATEALFQVIRKNPKISRHFHLPLQSASDRILKRMKRLHTFEQYRLKIDRMRELIPDISVTTDIIVGFPGETEEDYNATVRAIELLRYDSAFIYKYSPRPGTPATRLEDDVSEAEKERRNRHLLEIQKRIARDRNHDCVGRLTEVFIEGPALKDAHWLSGRNPQDRWVRLQGPKEWVGSFKQVAVTEIHNGSLIGEVREPVAGSV